MKQGEVYYKRPELMSLQRTMVALSLSEPDTAILQYAKLLVKLGCKDFRFVHVVTPAHTPAGDWNPASLLKRIQDEVRQHFEDGAEGVQFTCHVLQGGARIDSLVEFATEQQVEVILLGHRKARSGRRSLARRLAMVSPCSIWMVPEGTPVKLSTIMVPIDFSENSADAVSVATSIAARAGLKECRALHVFFDPSTIRYDEHVHEVLGKEEATFAKFIEPINCHGVRVEPMFAESTHPAQEILRMANRLGKDLIVMSTRGRSRAAAILLGSVTSEVIQGTNIPILAVKHYGAKMNLFQALFDHRTWTSEIPKTN